MYKEKILECVSESGANEIFCGFSGGADSTALLMMLHRSEGPYNLTAVHFEHGLRGTNGERDAEWCSDFCIKHEIPFILKCLDVPASKLPTETVEAAARRLRLEGWKRIIGEVEKKSSRKDLNCAVALAHHADDLAENLLLRLARGSNSSGLYSMRKIRELDGIKFLRPLLDFHRSELIEFLHAEGIDSWCEDETNKQSEFSRNFIRNKIMNPLYRKMPYAKGGIRQSLNVLSADADYLQSEAEKFYHDISGSETSSVEFWADMHPALRPRVLRIWLSKQLDSHVIPSAAFLNRFNEVLAAGGEKSETHYVPAGQNVYLKIRNGKVSVKDDKEVEDKTPEKIWNWQTKKTLEWGNFKIDASRNVAPTDYTVKNEFKVYFDLENFPEQLIVRAWKFGDRMLPFGSKSEKKLKKIFNDAGIGEDEKGKYPVLALADGKIIWIPGVKRSDFKPLKAGSERCIRFTAVLSEKK